MKNPVWCILAITLLGATNAFVVPRQGVKVLISPSATGSYKPSVIPTWATTFSATLHAVPSTQAVASAAATAATTSNDELVTFFWQTLIANGIPAALTVIVILIAAAVFRPKPGEVATQNLEESIFGIKLPAAILYSDLYGDQDQFIASQKKPKNFLEKLFRGGGGSSSNKLGTLSQNVGVPAEQYIRLTHLNKKYDSYQYSLTAALDSKAAAAAQFRKSAFGRAWQRALVGDNTTSTAAIANHWTELQTAEQAFLKEGRDVLAELQALQTKLTASVVDDEMKSMGLTTIFPLDPSPVNMTANSTTANKKSSSKDHTSQQATLTRINQLQHKLQDLELNFIKHVIQAVGPEQAASVRMTLLGDIAVRGSGSLLRDLQERPLQTLLSSSSTNNTSATNRLFVCRFPGDPMASQVSTLREEVTAICRNANPGQDEVLVVLQTGGGTVTGYGLAAAQLLRFKNAGLYLTIAVEQVAASGGYMMCCVADRIVASPFAVLGSIGVITDIPNVYERLKQEGIEFQTVTAGKYKRTLTPTKKVTKADYDKTKEDVEEILKLFRNFVSSNRPQLDIDAVATGETWFGTDALNRKLCDEIKTVDAVLTEYVDQGFDVYELAYKPPLETPFGRILPANTDADMSSPPEGLIGRGVRWLVRTIAAEVKAAIRAELDDFDQNANSKPIQERYMMLDDRADKVKSQD